MPNDNTDLKGRRAVIYARYSPGPDQREESIVGQIRECRGVAEKAGLVVIHEYTDRRMSGTNDERPDFQQMLRDADRHLFDVLIVWKNDRFARNRYDAAIYKHRLKKAGVRLMYAREHIPEGPEGILFEALMEGMAEYYSANLAQNIRRGLHENALEGKSIGGTTPLGYKLSEDKRYVLDPAAAPIVKEIFTRYAAGEANIDICRDLNARGYTTVTGKHFNKGSLHRILANEKYLGVFRYGDIVRYDLIPPIVDQETFDAAAARSAANKRQPHKAPEGDEAFLLTGKLFCGLCGSPMGGTWGTSKNGTRHSYYTCNAKKTKHSCKKKAERKAQLEKLVVSAVVENILNNDKVINFIVDRCVAIQEEEVDRAPVLALKKELALTQEKHKNIMAAIEAGIITSSTKSRLVEIEGRLEELKAGIAAAEIVPPKFSRDMLLFMFEKFKNKNTASPEFMREIIDVFVHAVYVFDDRCTITFNYSGDNTREYSLSDLETDLQDGALVFDMVEEGGGVRLLQHQVHHLLQSRTKAVQLFVARDFFGITLYS